jgi:hypothetical protein
MGSERYTAFHVSIDSPHLTAFLRESRKVWAASTGGHRVINERRQINTLALFAEFTFQLCQYSLALVKSAQSSKQVSIAAVATALV